MNKKGFELAISTIVLLIIGIAVLIGLILFFRRGLSDFEDNTGSFLENSEAIIVKEACETACEASSRAAFCCGNKTVQGRAIRCDDARLEVNCGLSCEGFEC